MQQVLSFWKSRAAKLGPSVGIVIDGRKITAPEGASILDACRLAEIYLPALCAHPDLPPACQRGAEDAGCKLCLVEIEGRDGLQKACSTALEEGLVVRTSTDAIQRERRENLARILSVHPHVCLTCPQRDGCSRTECSYGNPVEQRCCSIFNSCELRKVSDYIGIPNNTPKYKHIQLPVIKDEPFYDRDYNLCIDCRRCLVACNDVRGVGCLEIKETRDGNATRKWVGTIAATLIESGCKFCSACVTVCPTGALRDRTLDPARLEQTQVPCKAACPAGIDVPRYVQLAGLGRYGEATAVVREKLPFPGILGRACFAMCESACRRKDLDDPLSIRSLKRLAADHDTGLWRQYSKQLAPSGHKAAVVGAGPAGLTAAYYLAKKGHAVTLFEALPAAGGMARYGIPSYRVPPEVIDQEVDEVRKLGVEFRFGSRIEDLDELFAQGYETVFLGIGAQAGQRLGIPGDSLPNVVDSPTFLRAATMGKIGTAQSPVMMGRHVAVIGGGNVATDDARTSRRLGGEQVDIVYRRSREQMPARQDEFEGCVEEGVNFRYLTAPKKIEIGGGARLKVTFARTELGEPDSSGRRRPVEIPGSEFEEECDLIIAAVGQEAETYPEFKIQTGKGGRVNVREDSLATSRPGVFAGGDCVLGPATLIDAVAHGRLAAAAMDKFLGGDGNIEEKLLPDDWDTDPFIGRQEGFNRIARFQPIYISKERRLGWEEVELGLDEPSGRAEGLRCLKCNLAARIEEAVLPPESWLEFCESVVALATDKAGVFQLLDAEKNVLMIKGVENLRQGLTEQLGKNPLAKHFICEEAPMYTQRESQFIQAYLQQYGKMPGGGASELDDLF
ncbi:MAG: FAD-dependent oxidoreductase [Betaproteobacteria bacterium]|nr:FAD-dependent oxidoreductase [Betaproteobacteria bacterium]